MFPSVTIRTILLPFLHAFAAPQVALANRRPFLALYAIPRRVRNNYRESQKHMWAKKGKQGTAAYGSGAEWANYSYKVGFYRSLLRYSERFHIVFTELRRDTPFRT